MQHALERPADRRKQFLRDRTRPFEIHSQDGRLLAGLGLHLRPPELSEAGPMANQFAPGSLAPHNVSQQLPEQSEGIVKVR
jgi:hypothetical protein